MVSTVDSPAPGPEERDASVAAQRGFAVARAGFAAVLLLTPRRAARAWFGREPTGALVSFCRLVGVRDAVLSAGLLSGRGDPRRWTRLAAVADASDALVAAVALRRSRSRLRTAVSGLLAASSAAAEVRLLRHAGAAPAEA